MEREESVHEMLKLPPLPRLDQQSPHIKNSIKTSTGKKKDMVTGYSLLRGMEAPICRPESIFREVCCLPRDQVMDFTKELSTAFRALPISSVSHRLGTSDVASRSLKRY